MYVLRSGEPFSVTNERSEDPLVVPLFLTFDFWQNANKASDLITLGTGFFGIVRYLKNKRDAKGFTDSQLIVRLRISARACTRQIFDMQFLRNQTHHISLSLQFLTNRLTKSELVFPKLACTLQSSVILYI